jgi:anti-anti-sigma factor
LEITVSDVGNESTVILKGEIDLGTAPLLDAEVARLAGDGRRCIRVDLRDVSFMDSHGIKVLAGAHKRLSTVGGTLSLVAPTQPVRRVLELTAVDRLLSIDDC